MLTGIRSRRPLGPLRGMTENPIQYGIKKSEGLDKFEVKEGGILGIFLGLVAIWAYFSLLARKEKRRDDIIYHQAFIDAQQEVAAEQSEYDQMLLALPAILGPETFSVRVNTNSAEIDAIANYVEYLERIHSVDSQFEVILEHERSHPSQSSALRVEAGKATLGYLYLDDNKAVCDELDAIGGKASCEARLKKERFTGIYELYLDLDYPLLID
jgi:hypothetical protein